MEKNVMSLIQQQAEKIFSIQTNSSPNVDVVPSLKEDLKKSMPNEEEQNASMLNNIGLEIQRQGGI